MFGGNVCPARGFHSDRLSLSPSLGLSRDVPALQRLIEFHAFYKRRRTYTVVVKLIRAQILSFRPLHGIAVDRYCAEVPRIIQVSVPTSFDIGFNIEAALLSVIKGHDELVGTAVTHILGLGWYSNQAWRFMCLESTDRIGPFQAGSFQNAVSRPNGK